MHTFTDVAERTWTIQVNVAAIKRVRSLLDVNLLEVLDDGCKLLIQLHDDPILLCDVLYAICQPQAEAQNVSDEEFGRGLAGDALLTAAEALLQGLVDFFPDARRRAVLAELLAKLNQAGELAVETAKLRIEAFDPAAAITAWEKRLADSANASSGSSPASQASIPRRSRSANSKRSAKGG